MSHLTEEQLRKRWSERWGEFLEDLEESQSPDALVGNVLRDKRTIGNAERKIAGGHEGREILELLQNARDAIQERDTDSGSVHVGVYDEGVLVANTGSRFDLFDTEVEDAVTMIGETGKSDGKSIGHKGVGLKSILATGDSFEIFTRPEQDSDEILGVRLSRSYVVGALLSRLGQDVEHNTTEIDDPEVESLLKFDNGDSQTIEIDEGVADSISKLPLFYFPVPIQTDGASGDGIQDRVHEILTEGGSEERFRTAVFIRYEDTEWRSMLSEFGIPIPDEDERDIEDRPDRIWNYLSSEAGEGGLRPETVVQLGGIENLYLERISESSGRTEEHWEIHHETSPDVRTAGLKHNDVHVRISTGTDEGPQEIHSFDHFSFDGGSEYSTSILVNKSAESDKTPVESYPLYLFYPIESTSDAELPFCLHGRFRVETNRKNLSKNRLDKNQDVLEEGLDLIELVGKEVAAATDESESADYSSHLPWSLLPPVPDTRVAEPKTQKELISWLQSQTLERLGETKCIATTQGPCTPDETLLHWEYQVLGSYVAFNDILDETGREPVVSGARPLPDYSLVKRSLTIPALWTDRIREILTEDGNVSEVSDGILEDWATHLDASLSSAKDGSIKESPAIEVNSESARSLLQGTVALLIEATDEEDQSVERRLDHLSNYLDSVYLLPCRIKDAKTDERLALVTVEKRQTPTGGSKTATRTRSVIWGVESETQDVDRPLTPPTSSNMTVYFLDEEVQEIPDVGHVLGKAGRLWGIREYEGIPSFVRSLLDSFADGEREVVKPIDFAFLAAVVDRLGKESRDLQSGEGSFFPLSYLRDAVSTSEGDQRGNLRRRVQLRRRELELHSLDPHRISGTVLGDGWQRIQELEESSEEDDDPTEGWEVIDKDDYPAPVWPEPGASTWKEFRGQINKDVDDSDFVRTLSLLGTGTIPDIRVVWMYGDKHPTMQGNPDWNPLEWGEEDFAEDVPVEIKGLQDILVDNRDYLSTVTGPGYHPQETANHSSKCSVKTDRKTESTNIASWIWIDDTESMVEHSEAVREMLRRHGEDFDNLLRTGWSCDYQHKRRSWDESVPSLLNWQLRSLGMWDPVVNVNDELEEPWGEHSSKLRYAVRLESKRGVQAARMFPHVGDEHGFLDSLLDALGVRPVNELEPAAAAEHLQKLQSVLVNGSLPDEGTSRLWIPGERLNDWNQAYNQLIQPLLKRLPEDGDDKEEMDWGRLTHLPLQENDEWVTAPVEWIIENKDSIRYFQDNSPKPWERQAVDDEGYLILPRTPGPFTRLSRFLGIGMVDASKLVFEPDEVEITTDEYDEVSDFRRELIQRRDVLVASTERTDEDEIEETSKTLSRAAENLAVAGSFPEEGLRQLSEPTSALYATEDGEALILNAEEFDEGLSLEGLAMGVSLLFERPTKVATFREALQPSMGVNDLEERWEKRTFPIGTVKRVLGSNALDSFERRMSALNQLLDRVGKQSVDAGPALTALEDSDTDDVDLAQQWLSSGEPPSEGVDDVNLLPEVRELVDETNARVPGEMPFVIENLFSDTVTHWVHELEERDLDTDVEVAIIEWLNENRRVFERPPFNKEARKKYERFLTVSEIWEQTDDSELTEPDVWRTRLKEMHSTGEVSWTDEIPSSYAEEIDHHPLVVYLCVGNRVDSLLNQLIEEIESGVEGRGIEFDWQSTVEEYVFDGRIPEPESEAGAKDHQKNAFDDIATSVADGATDVEPIEVETESVASKSTITSSESRGSGGGGSSQLKGRGQQAEAFVMATVLERLSDHFDEAAVDAMRFRAELRNLEENQGETNYQWHVDRAWSSLEDILHGEELTQSSITDWQSRVADGTPLRELPAIRLINITMEMGPGFDVIDPLGPISEEGMPNFGFEFVPVEVKAVDGDEPPFRFRLTTNEYRRAKAFVRDGDIPYVIRLVEVPESGTPNWPSRTKIVAEKILRNVEDVEEIIDAERFEEHVKGGYMNMTIE